MTSSPALNHKLANGPLADQTLEFHRHLEQWGDAHTRGVALLSRFCAAATAVHGVDPEGKPAVEPLPPHLAALVPAGCMESAAERDAAASWRTVEDSHEALRGVMDALEENATGMAVAVQQASAAVLREGADSTGGQVAGGDVGEEAVLAKMRAIMCAHENEMQLKAAIVDSLWSVLEMKSIGAVQSMFAKYCASWELLPYCSTSTSTETNEPE